MFVRDGFPGERFRVLPRPQVKVAATSPITERMLVTDAGYFPHAAAHGRMRPHGARETIVIVCAEGAGSVELAGVHHAVPAGHAIVIPARTGHTYVADEVAPWSIWWFHLTGIDVPELVAQIVGENQSPVFRVHDLYSTVAAIDQIVTAMEADETTATLFATAGIAWGLMARFAADRRRGDHVTSERLRVVQDHLREHLDAPTSVPELARLAGLSPSHFSAVFKRTMGTSVSEFVKRQRSARARELLATTDLSIQEIAQRVGYDDPFYFSRQFHAVNGASPRDFRASQRQVII